MGNFSEYWVGDISLEDRLFQAFDELSIAQEQRDIIDAYLALLRKKSAETYDHYCHSIRVGLLSWEIAKFLHLDEKALLYAGLLHDIGKALVDPKVLGKTEEWTEADAKLMEAHVLDSYRLLDGRFDFTAQIVLWHHKFQKHGYPEVMPAAQHEYSHGTMVTIAFYGRVLALADCFDALHRHNSKFGSKPLTGEEIKQKMFDLNPDQVSLIGSLYEANIFTTWLKES